MLHLCLFFMLLGTLGHTPRAATPSDRWLGQPHKFPPVTMVCGHDDGAICTFDLTGGSPYNPLPPPTPLSQTYISLPFQLSPLTFLLLPLTFPSLSLPSPPLPPSLPY